MCRVIVEAGPGPEVEIARPADRMQPGKEGESEVDGISREEFGLAVSRCIQILPYLPPLPEISFLSAFGYLFAYFSQFLISCVPPTIAGSPRNRDVSGENARQSEERR